MTWSNVVRGALDRRHGELHLHPSPRAGHASRPGSALRRRSARGQAAQPDDECPVVRHGERGRLDARHRRQVAGGEHVVELHARARARVGRRAREHPPPREQARERRRHVEVAEQHARAGQRAQRRGERPQLRAVPARDERQVRGGDRHRSERGLDDGGQPDARLVPQPDAPAACRAAGRGSGPGRPRSRVTCQSAPASARQPDPVRRSRRVGVVVARRPPGAAGRADQRRDEAPRRRAGAPMRLAATRAVRSTPPSAAARGRPPAGRRRRRRSRRLPRRAAPARPGRRRGTCRAAG